MIDSVKLHLLVLLNVSDQITRNQSQHKIGILLGNSRQDDIVVQTSFEIVIKNGTIDQEFLFTRYGQFKTVLPNYNIVGFYQVGEFTNLIQPQLVNFFNTYNIPYDELMVIFDRDLITSVNASSTYANHPVKSILLSNESERISTITTLNHAKYTDESTKQDVSINLHQNSISQAINQLSDRIETILTWIKSGNTLDFQQNIAIKNQITFLASKLKPFKHSSSNFQQLQASQLSLLTEQLVSLENLQSEIKNNILRYTVTNFQNVANYANSGFPLPSGLPL